MAVSKGQDIRTDVSSFPLVSWADILHAADHGFRQTYRDAHEFAGLKVTYNRQSTGILSITLAVERDGRPPHAGSLPGRHPGAGGNPGFQAPNLAG